MDLTTRLAGYSVSQNFQAARPRDIQLATFLKAAKLAIYLACRIFLAEWLANYSASRHCKAAKVTRYSASYFFGNETSYIFGCVLEMLHVPNNQATPHCNLIATEYIKQLLNGNSGWLNIRLASLPEKFGKQGCLKNLACSIANKFLQSEYLACLAIGSIRQKSNTLGSRIDKRTNLQEI